MDLRKLCSCSQRTRTIIVGYICILIYTISLVVSIYLQVLKPEDVYLIALNSIVPLMLIFICVLLYGVYKTKPNFMLPWLVLKFLSLVVFSIILVLLCGTTIVSLIHEQFILFIPFITSLISVGLFWFLHYLIYQYYKYLTELPPKHTEDLASIVTKE